MTRNFYADVYAVVKLIPEGRFTSYGAIAQYLGSGLSARMVGWAMNAAHVDDTIPAHRVLNRNGALTGRHHFNPPTLMQALLEKENIRVENDKVVDFDKHFWNPADALL